MKKILTDIKEMIIHPKSVHERIDGKNSFHFVLLTTILISILFVYIFWNFQFDAMMNDPLHTNDVSDWGKTTSTIVYTTTIAFVTFFVICFQSFYYLFSFNFIKGKNNVKISQVVQTTAMAKLITSFSSIVSIIKAHTLESTSFDNLADFKQAIYVPIDLTFIVRGLQGGFYRVAQTISLFPIWESVVVVFIFSGIYKMPIKKSITPVIIIWIVKLLIAYASPTNPALL